MFNYVHSFLCMYIANRVELYREVSEVFPTKSSHSLRYILHSNCFLNDIYQSFDIYKTEIVFPCSKTTT